MTVLLTGASGFIGLNIAEALLRRGETVVLLSRRIIGPDAPADLPAPLRAASRVLSALPGDLRSISVDMRDGEAVARIMAEVRPEAVIHGAALTPGAEREILDAHATVETNILGTLNILEAARKTPPGRFVHLSSGAVFGERRAASGALDEGVDLPVPDSVYSITKYASERLALRWRALLDLDLVAARVGTVFGPWEWPTGVRETISTVFQLTRLAVRGSPAVLPVAGTKDWIYSRDIADAVLALIDAPRLANTVYHLGPGIQWSLLDWCAKLAVEFEGFTYRLAEPGEEGTVFYGSKDRDPFAISRLAEDTGFRAAHDLDASATDYFRWIKDTPDFWQEEERSSGT